MNVEGKWMELKKYNIGWNNPDAKRQISNVLSHWKFLTPNLQIWLNSLEWLHKSENKTKTKIITEIRKEILEHLQDRGIGKAYTGE